MRLTTAFVISLVTVAAAACNSDPVHHLADAPGHGSGSNDGGGSGSGSDGPIGGDTSCGAAIQTVAGNPITLSGTISDDDTTFGTNGAGLVGAAVTAYQNANGTAFGSDTTGAGTGLYMIESTTGLPIDYITMAEAGYTSARYYVKAPAASTKTLAKLAMLKTTSTAALPGTYGTTQSGADGVVVALIADCNSTRLSGATVSISPPGSSVIRYVGGGSATDSSGVALIFDAPPGSAAISATASGLTMRAVLVAIDPTYTTMVTISEK